MIWTNGWILLFLVISIMVIKSIYDSIKNYKLSKSIHKHIQDEDLKKITDKYIKYTYYRAVVFSSDEFISMRIELKKYFSFIENSEKLVECKYGAGVENEYK